MLILDGGLYDVSARTESRLKLLAAELPIYPPTTIGCSHRESHLSKVCVLFIAYPTKAHLRRSSHQIVLGVEWLHKSYGSAPGLDTALIQDA